MPPHRRRARPQSSGDLSMPLFGRGAMIAALCRLWSRGPVHGPIFHAKRAPLSLHAQRRVDTYAAILGTRATEPRLRASVTTKQTTVAAEDTAHAAIPSGQEVPPLFAAPASARGRPRKQSGTGDWNERAWNDAHSKHARMHCAAATGG